MEEQLTKKQVEELANLLDKLAEDPTAGANYGEALRRRLQKAAASVSVALETNGNTVHRLSNTVSSIRNEISGSTQFISRFRCAIKVN
jgi:hypothetical protein